MIVADRFVFLAFPRTGTTFVRNALMELYRRTEPRRLTRLVVTRGGRRGGIRELILPITDTASAEREQRKSQHGRYAQIPPEARQRPVVTIVRDPFDLLVSAYEHRYWRQHPIADIRTLERAYPGYPNLAFDQYVAMMHEHGVRDLAKGATLRADVGHITLRFLKMYGRDPERIVASLTDDAIDRGLFREDLAPVRFLPMEKLVAELRAFLEEVGFPPATTAFIEKLSPVNAAPSRAGRGWSEYYTPELRATVRHKERALFTMFPRYDS